jgi:hypothetical protein
MFPKRHEGRFYRKGVQEAKQFGRKKAHKELGAGENFLHLRLFAAKLFYDSP